MAVRYYSGKLIVLPSPSVRELSWSGNLTSQPLRSCASDQMALYCIWRWSMRCMPLPPWHPCSLQARFPQAPSAAPFPTVLRRPRCAASMAYEGPLLASAWLMACPYVEVAVDQSAFAVASIPAERGPRHSRRRISLPTLVVAYCAGMAPSTEHDTVMLCSIEKPCACEYCYAPHPICRAHTSTHTGQTLPPSYDHQEATMRPSQCCTKYHHQTELVQRAFPCRYPH